LIKIVEHVNKQKHAFTSSAHYSNMFMFEQLAGFGNLTYKSKLVLIPTNTSFKRYVRIKFQNVLYL